MRLDLSKDPKVWEEVSPMNEPRSSFGIADYNDKIYVFGGFANNTKNIEVT